MKLETLLLKAAAREDFSSVIEDVAAFYKDDVDKIELQHQ